MKVTKFHQYALQNKLNLSGEFIAHNCLLFISDEEVERTVLYDIKTNQCHDIDPNCQYLRMGYDEEHVCLSAHPSYLRIFDRKRGISTNEISIVGYRPMGGYADSPISYTVFNSKSSDEHQKHKLVDLKSGTELSTFTQPEGLRLIYSRHTENRVDMRPSAIYAMNESNESKVSDFTFLSYDIKNDTVKTGRVESDNYYQNFLGYVSDYTVYHSLQIGEVIVISPTGEIVQSINLDGYEYKKMCMVGFSSIDDVFYLLYQASGIPTIVEANTKSDSVKFYKAPIPKSKFIKTDWSVDIPTHHRKMIFKDRYICLDSLKGGSIEFPQKMKWVNRHFNYLGNGQFVIVDYNFSSGVYTGFSLGAFEGSSLPENPAIGKIKDIEKIEPATSSN